MSITGFITVRTSSARLPQKCLLPFGDGNVLEHIIRRSRHFGIAPIVCTSTDPTDDIVETIAKSEGVPFFRGSLQNKLKRWADCAHHFSLQLFHTVDADDPFFDADEMQRSIAYLKANDLDMVEPTPYSSGGGASVGYSLKTDIVARSLAGIADEADTEMMWYHIKKVHGAKIAALPESPRNGPSQVRMTLDYPEDYWLLESVRRMVGNLAPRDIVDDLFRRNPDLCKINWFRNEMWKAGQDAKRV